MFTNDFSALLPDTPAPSKMIEFMRINLADGCWKIAKLSTYVLNCARLLIIT